MADSDDMRVVSLPACNRGFPLSKVSMRFYVGEFNFSAYL